MDVDGGQGIIRCVQHHVERIVLDLGLDLDAGLAAVDRLYFVICELLPPCTNAYVKSFFKHVHLFLLEDIAVANPVFVSVTMLIEET